MLQIHNRQVSCSLEFPVKLVMAFHENSRINIFCISKQRSIHTLGITRVHAVLLVNIKKMASVIEGSGQLQTKKQPPRVPLLVIPTAYAVLGAMTTIVNKIILSSYDFPCTFLMLACQLCVSLAICIAYSKYPVERQLLSPPKWSTTTFRACLPLSLVFVSNVAFGFFGLQALTVSMFVSLRRLSILTILAVEVWLLRVVPSRTTLVACTIIVIGVIVASMHDIMFDLWGYIAVFLNNMFTAMYWSMSNKVLNNTVSTLSEC